MDYMMIKTTDLRPRLTELMDRVESGDAQVIVKRYGRARVAIVRFEDLFRIWELETDEQLGPKEEALDGKRIGEISDDAKAQLADDLKTRKEYRALGLDGRWNRFWVWVKSLHD